ncbi:MAG TPA: diguanylate cyclase [Caldithrix abyssi]|uniref:diguanylate cyclase n=1 Tax=Caldithrix abyssi TaxID=187145 RepID=A0A7V4WWW2_CALAY|nr:diguanylate cyclase [Caldithrix abyssi]
MNSKTRKILYIEDDPEARTLMADIIRYKGYIYLEAARGLEGIHLAREHKPDLILIDLRLPDMQGYEVTTHLKSLPGLRDTPIIALTGETQKNAKEIVLTAGCDGYISKPINVTEFLFKIEEYLSGRKDVVPEEDEKHFLQQYNIQLVSRLKKKITELEQMNINLTKLNRELEISHDQLSQYNDRLFYLNNLANQLRTETNPERLIKLLPQKIAEGFHIERCIFFKIDRESLRLEVFSYVGETETNLKKIKFKISPDFLQYLKRENGILWIKNINEILDKSLLTLARKLSASSFLVGNLSYMGTQQEATRIIYKISQASDIDSPPAPSQQYLFFMDKGVTGTPFATYEVRILKSFMQTMGIIYENILLYARLMKLYHIREKQAMHDELTGVYNYRYFIQELERETNRTKRFNYPFSLLMIDVDYFKEFNDTHGHLEGDRVLKTIAAILKENIRTTDTVARYGGEEFTVILPHLTKEEAAQIAEKLRKKIEGFNFDLEKPSSQRCPITVSIGVAALPEDADNSRELLMLADKALYKAKKSGRNKVCLS